MREAARIQSFPDTFIFESKLRETERQIGNAVPPVLAWHVGKSIAKTLIKSDDQQLQAAA
jgi:DNA (cytosine-5)-methyltransferase 1